MDQVQALLQKLKENYLAEMPERLDRLELLVLAMESNGFSEESYHELYRQVHSLKGSGGTYGLHVISSICHPLEDFLNDIDDKTDLARIGFANITLGYLDVIRSVVERIMQQPNAVFDVENLIGHLRQRSFEPKYCALVVENSGTVVKLISRVLLQHNFRVVVEDDGYQALGRALATPFDLLITAQEVKQLNGSALIAAVKLARIGNHNLRTILLTANPLLQIASSLPNFILNKDDQLSPRLQEALISIVAEREN